MPPQKGKSDLLGKLGNRLAKAHEEHKNDETEYSKFGDLPPGIKNGIAQLVDCKFSQYEKGDNKDEFFFYAAGAVVEPKTHNGIRILNLRTSIMEPLCDTPNKKSRPTLEEHLAWIYNELRKLGVDTSNMTHEDLEETVKGLKAAAPFFRFSTWQGEPTKEYPDPRVNHRWEGATEFDEEEEDDTTDNSTYGDPDDFPDGSTDEVEEEETPPEPPKKISKTTKPATKTEVAKTPPPKKPSTKTTTKAKEPEPEPEPDEEPEETDERSVEELAEAADKGEKKATKLLQDIAKEIGMTDAELTAAKDWAAVAEEVNNRSSANEEAAEEEVGEEEEQVEDKSPKVEQVFKFRPQDPKTKKPSTKSVDVLVVSVDDKTETVVLKNLGDGKTTYKNISWNRLEPS